MSFASISRAIVLMVLCACAPPEKTIRHQDAERIHVGMPEGKVSSIMGKPTRTHSDATGQVWVWIYREASPSGSTIQSLLVKMRHGRVTYVQTD